MFLHLERMEIAENVKCMQTLSLDVHYNPVKTATHSFLHSKQFLHHTI